MDDVRTLGMRSPGVLGGRFRSSCKPVRNEAGVFLRTEEEEEMHRWREHFKIVLNHEESSNPPEIEPSVASHMLRSRML